MNRYIAITRRASYILGLTALLILGSTGCFWFQCNIWGGGDCGDEDPGPPSQVERDPSIGTVTVEPDEVEALPGTRFTAIVNLSDKPSDEVVPEYEVSSVPDGVTATLDTSVTSEAQPDLALLNVQLGATPIDSEAVSITVAATATGYSESSGRLRINLKQVGQEATAGAVAVSAGTRYSLALLDDGTVLGWGDNLNDQLGLGEFTSGIVTRPMPIDGLSSVAEIEAGSETSIARTDNGEVWVWGSNSYGQLADASVVFDAESPIQVSQVNPATKIHGGQYTNFASRNSGDVYGWGWGAFLASDSIPISQSHDEPVVVPDLLGVEAISSGRTHVLAVRPDGAVLAWGVNDSGALGNNSTAERWQIDVVPGLSNVEAVAAGAGFSLALDSNGTVWAWGANNVGQLGIGNRVDQLTPVQVSGLTDVVAIDTHRDHSLALKSDGTIWTWGSDQVELLGIDNSPGAGLTALNRDVPRQIPGLSGMTAISAGANHSMAVDSCGRVWTWGVNAQGQLGNGTLNDGPIPSPVPGIGLLNPCDNVILWQEKSGTGGGTVRKDTGNGGQGPNIATNGGLFTNSTDLNCGPICSETFNPGEVVTLIAEPDPGSRFDLWTGDCSGTQPQVTLNMTDSMTCIAVFQQTPLNLLTVNTDGPGRVSGAPAGIDCGADCSEQLVRGTSVVLTAEPGELARFQGWSGEPDCVGGSDPTVIELTVVQPVSCTAEFVSLTELVAPAPSQSQGITSEPYTLEVLRAGPSVGTVTGTGIDCGQDCIEEFDAGASTSVTLTAEDDLNGGAIFGSWLGCDEENGNQCTVTVDSSRNVTAFFLAARVSPGVIEPSTFDLAVAKDGRGNGSIVASGIDCGQDCSESYDDGSQVTLTPQPDARSVFAGWGGDADCADGSVTLNADLSCTGTFNLKTFGLNVDISGSGNGAVTSSPNGIDCGADCDETYDIDSVVTLTASEDPGSQFVGWSGTDFDLAITHMVATPQPVEVGEEITYKIDVTNLGVALAPGVLLTTFTSGTSPNGQTAGPPPDASIVSFTASQGSCSQPNGASNPVECSLGDLPGNATATVTLVLTPNSPTLPLALGLGPFRIGASVSVSGTGNNPDVDPSNNVASLATQVLPSSGVDLTVTMTDLEPGPVGLSSNLTLTLEIVNNGPDNASNINLLASTGDVSMTPTGAASGPGVSATLLSSTPSQGNCFPLSGTTATLDCTLGSLAAGGQATVEITIKPTSPTLPLALGMPPLSYNAQVFTRNVLGLLGNDLDPSNNEASIETHILPSSGADLSISSTAASPELAPVGGNLTYSFEVTNHGPDPAQGVVFTTLMNATSYQSPGAMGPPPDVTFVSASTSQGSCPPAIGTSVPLQCALGTLSPGATVNISVVAAANSATLPLALGLPPLTNTGAVFTQSALLGNDSDPNPSNNVASVSSRVLPGDCSGAATSIQITIDANIACLATFNQVYTLSLSFLGNGGGMVTADQGILNCDQDCAETYSLDALVTLTATPDPSSDFAVWTGDCSGTDPAIQVLMSQDSNCTAHFNIDDDEPGGSTSTGSGSGGGGSDDGGGDDGGDDGGGDGDYTPPG